MAPQLPPSSKAARKGFWVAVALGSLGLLSILVSPVQGLVLAALFFAVAAGIRRRQAWAALTGAAVLLLPVLAIGTRWKDFSSTSIWVLVIDCAITLACLYWMAGSAVALWRDRAASRRSWPWITALAVILVASLSLRPFAFSSGSMENTLLMGDYVMTENLTWNLGRTPQRGDIVLIRYPVDRNQTFTKRVLGVPGDRLRIVNKQVLRNGSPLTEPYAVHKSDYVDPFRDNFPSTPTVQLASVARDMLQNHVRDGEVVVPPGRYFVLGDNRDNSLDSRYWGFVSRSDILGSPLLVYASYDGTPSIAHMRWNRLLKPL